MSFPNLITSTKTDGDYFVGVSPTFSTTPCSQNLYNSLFGRNFSGISFPEFGTSEKYFFKNINFQETRGESISIANSFLQHENIFSSLNDSISNIKEKKIKEQAFSFVEIIMKEIQKVDNSFTLQPLYGFFPDDGSFLIEWIYDQFRIGFSFEEISSQSSWYLVSTTNMGGINASGYLSPENQKSVIVWLLNFIIGSFN